MTIIGRTRRLLLHRILQSSVTPSAVPYGRPTLERSVPTRRSLAAWWNPFSRTDSSRDGGAHVASSRTVGVDDADHPRRIQERKDAILAILALEFQRLSVEYPSKERQEIVDMAFDEVEQKELDGKTTLQLRHELQSCLEPQVVSLFHAFGKVDESLGMDFDESENEQANQLIDQMLQLELERAIDELANPNPTQASKGVSPKIYFEIKRGALETLIDRRKALTQPKTSEEEIEKNETGDEKEKKVAWVDADEFGYHETIDDARNQLIRHYQAVNMCRSARLRDTWGYSVIALQSSIPGAGRGVFVDGFAKAGSILAFQPGTVWSKEHLVNLPVETERQLEKNDHYQMSLRPDDFMIDSRKSPYTVLTGDNCNMMALGHIINHPTAVSGPNCRTVMVDFTQGMELGASLSKYIPNTYARPRNLTLMGSLFEREAVEMHGMCVVATRDICNEEIFYDYRLVTSQLPSWYHPVEDTSYEEEEEATGSEKNE